MHRRADDHRLSMSGLPSSFSEQSTGAGSRRWRLSFVSSQHQTVRPHRGHEKKSRGIMRECPPPPWPSLLSLLLHLLPPTPPHTHHFLLTSLVLYFLLGSILLQREGKWNCFEGSMEIPLPEWSCLLCGPLGLQLCRMCCVQCQARWNSYDARFKNHLYKIYITAMNPFCAYSWNEWVEWNKSSKNVIFSCILVTHPSSESGFTEAKNKPVQTEDLVIKLVLTLKALLCNHLLNFGTRTKSHR